MILCIQTNLPDSPYSQNSPKQDETCQARQMREYQILPNLPCGRITILFLILAQFEFAKFTHEQPLLRKELKSHLNQKEKIHSAQLEIDSQSLPDTNSCNGFESRKISLIRQMYFWKGYFFLNFEKVLGQHLIIQHLWPLSTAFEQNLGLINVRSSFQKQDV